MLPCTSPSPSPALSLPLSPSITLHRWGSHPSALRSDCTPAMLLGSELVNRSFRLIQTAVTPSQTRCPLQAQCLPFFLLVLPLCEHLHPQQKKKKKTKCCKNDSLYENGALALCSSWAGHTGSLCGCGEGGPSPPLPCFSSTPQRLPFSQCLAGGKLDPFCSEGFFGEAVKAVTVWAFISPEKRRGRKDREREGKREMGDRGGVWGGGTKRELRHRQPC